MLIGKPEWGYCQFAFGSQSARGAGMGGVSVGLHDVWSAIDGVASLSTIDAAVLSMTYHGDNWVGSYRSLAMALPFMAVSHRRRPIGTMALHYTYYGSSVYNEQQSSLSFALPLGSIVAIGASLHYYRSTASDQHYAPLNLMSCALGVSAELTHNISVGLRISNPATSFQDGGMTFTLPCRITFGTAYVSPEGHVISVANLEYWVGQKVSFRCGMEYGWEKGLYIRAGFSTAPAMVSVGVGYKRRMWSVDLAIQTYSTLGRAGMVTLAYHFKNRRTS